MSEIKTQPKGGRKECKRCGRNRTFEEFDRHARTKDGLIKICKECQSKRDGAPQKLKRRKIVKIIPTEKKCSGCDKIRGINEFSRASSQADDHARVCRFCKRKRRLTILDEMAAVKKKTPCVKCGFSDYRALEFAHKDGSDKAQWGSGRRKNPSDIDSLVEWKKELPKLRVMCRVCHRIETSKEHKENLLEYKSDSARHAARMRVYHSRELVLAEKLRRGSCIDCKMIVTKENGIAFDFDHLPGFEKTIEISKMVIGQKKEEDLRREWIKCALRCANCHRLITHTRLQDDKIKFEVQEVVSDMMHTLTQINL